MLSADRVLDALSGRMTAAQIAGRLGYPRTPTGAPTAREVVPALETLEAEGQVLRRTDVEGQPTVRWERA